MFLWWSPLGSSGHYSPCPWTSNSCGSWGLNISWVLHIWFSWFHGFSMGFYGPVDSPSCSPYSMVSWPGFYSLRGPFPGVVLKSELLLGFVQLSDLVSWCCPWYDLILSGFTFWVSFCLYLLSHLGPSTFMGVTTTFAGGPPLRSPSVNMNNVLSNRHRNF